MASGEPRELGRQGEEAAVRHLRRLKYRILARNLKFPDGEIDVVARDRNCLVFVEVKTRKAETAVVPIESVGFRKQNRLRRLAEEYLARRETNECEVRFDVISVLVRGRQIKVEHLQDAF